MRLVYVIIQKRGIDNMHYLLWSMQKIRHLQRSTSTELSRLLIKMILIISIL